MTSVVDLEAFSLWQMFSETISALLKRVGYSNDGVIGLAKIIKSCDFSIFVCERDANLTPEEYQNISDRFKSFTTWSLGCFFYLSCCERFKPSRQVLVELQLCVLKKLSNTQYHVYKEVASEYVKVLSSLVDFHKCQSDKTELRVFISQKYEDLDQKIDLTPVFVQVNRENFWDVVENVGSFLRFVLGRAFHSQFLSKSLENLLYLLSVAPYRLKLEISSIFLDLKNDNSVQIIHKFCVFNSLFEVIIYEVYNENIELSLPLLHQFEDVLVKFIPKCEDEQKKVCIAEFLLQKSYRGPLKPPEKVLEVALKHLDRTFIKNEFDGFSIHELSDFKVEALRGLKVELLKEINNCLEETEAKKETLDVRISKKWSVFHTSLFTALDEDACESICKIADFLNFFHELFSLFFEVQTEIGSSVKLKFFSEETFFQKVVAKFNRHFSKCERQMDFSLLFRFFNELSFVIAPWNLLVFFDVFSYPITRSLTSLSEFCGGSGAKKETAELYKNLIKSNVDRGVCFSALNEFLKKISCKLFEVRHVREIEHNYRRIWKEALAAQDENMQILLIKNVPHILSLFTNPEVILSEILTPSLSSLSDQILIETARILPTIVCLTHSDYTKVIKLTEGNVQILLFCDKCHKSLDRGGLNCVATDFQKIYVDSSSTAIMLKSLLKFLTCGSDKLKITSVEALPHFANHVLRFHSGVVATIWIDKCGDDDEIVRRNFAKIIRRVVRDAQGNSMLSESAKNDVLTILFDKLMILTKQSLKYLQFQLQETILATMYELCSIDLPRIILPIVRILIYLIMLPTSKHSLIAANDFSKLCKTHKWKAKQIYKSYRSEICEIIAHLCAVNQAAINQNLATSLSKISVTLEFYSCKDFLSSECQHLLPFFITKMLTMKSVEGLIREMTEIINIPLSELLVGSYGTIFLQIFLNCHKQDFKESMLYLEKTTSLSGPTLRRKNFSVILNELLINFHLKREKVEIALGLFKTEDVDVKYSSIQDYLREKFLGILQHFDFKLMEQANNRKQLILSSLADLFKFMGVEHIGPLRFKIIAMLRTADCGGFPELHCEVWDAFIKNCEADSLGPLLATIFVSLLPLMDSYPTKINEIFKYLIVENQNAMGDCIRDLFFVNDSRIDARTQEVINKYVRVFEYSPFKDKIQAYLKYLTHDTLEVRIRTLKHLKVLLEKNRSDLDQMILGYNGIDSVIVDLIDIVTLGCRDKNQTLKLACGEVIGELGAVEPSHLPRRYAQDSQDFVFFMKEDGFVVNILNELARALQGEKNTINMDRFALAIQEMLKFHEISPDEQSGGRYLWNQFSQAQQELMLPMLSSKYINSHSGLGKFPCPIYGSMLGTSFQFWLYNWTSSLISTLPDEMQAVPTACLPAMKHDHKILMQFLPHLLLNSITEGLAENCERAYVEIKTVITSSKSDQRIPTKILNKRPVPLLGLTQIIAVIPDEVKQTQCTKIVFVVLDFLNRWLREWHGQKGKVGSNDDNFVAIKNFLDRFCKLELARFNSRCGEYARALMYLEDYITENPSQINQNLHFLAKIYAELDEPDGVAGVTALQTTEPPVEERILALEISGKLSDAAACYERMPLPHKSTHLQGLVRCYLELDNANTALNFAQGALGRYEEFGGILFEMQAEPLWRLGRYEELETLLKNPELENNSSWGVQIGRALLSFGKGDRNEFELVLQKLKSQQVDFLGAASLEEGSYQHGYNYISRLHALNELEQVERATHEILLKRFDSTFVAQVIKELSKEWGLRIKVVQESLRIIEPLLCLRRVAIEQSRRILTDKAPSALSHIDELLGKCWLLSAKTARSAGVPQQAYTYALKAEEFAPQDLFLEKAKLHWLREEHEQALTTLQRGIEIVFPEMKESHEKEMIRAEAKLLFASYNDCMSNVDADVNVTIYKEAQQVTNWEKSSVCLAQFYDKIFQAYTPSDRDTQKGSEIQLYVINYFGTSLLYGTTYVYQSMPRLLSIWFDYGSRVLEVTGSTVKEERRKYLVKMTTLIERFFRKLHPFVFLTAFSQIVSRICHSQKEVYTQLKSIIVKLLVTYPQQTFWMMISVMKSGYSLRSKRCEEIFKDPNLKSLEMSKLRTDFTDLAEKLIELCNKDIPKDTSSTTISSLLRSLPRMLGKGNFSEILVPTHKFRKLVLPNPDFANSQHNPFPNRLVHIAGIEEEVTVLHSLQRPKKITFRGSDGKKYTQLLKPKDDLRKDFRLMEFNDIVNQLLSLEPEARQRRLNIRLYSVAPLNEECGIIEWLPNLMGLRPVLLGLYQQRGLGMRTRELKEASCSIRDPLNKKREAFTKVLLSKHPPILGEWFRRTFPDAQSWVFARTAYIRTTAVISMVGYILGLGDRHGENILLDSICGDTVHVDFNCLFNKGESFEWPERVPFRLTHNMVAAMGPLGVEGMFRKSCACTLRVLRTNTATLMSIVTPFVYDPLVSWQKNAHSLGNETTERTNEQAVDYVKNIELRLQGVVKARSRLMSIPLSIDGQTNNLINEAMSVDNLCQMYVGWGAFF